MIKLIVYLMLMAWCAVNVLAVISGIGKSRKPLTHDAAIGGVIALGLIAAGVSYLMWSGT